MYLYEFIDLLDKDSLIKFVNEDVYITTEQLQNINALLNTDIEVLKFYPDTVRKDYNTYEDVAICIEREEQEEKEVD